MKLNKYDIIVKPLVTEKSGIANQLNKYHFIVHVNATKDTVKKSVQDIFNVKVKSVNILNILGKVKKKGGKNAKMNDSKKAIVTLENGNNINYEN
ncbi:MAG: 50S ribosomal protein L23 [Rickettsiales bacterium]